MYLAGVNRPVDTGDTYFAEVSHLDVSGRTEARHRINQRPLIRRMPVSGIKVEARIEHTRWIVDCENCNGAEFYFEDGLFLCTQCGNSDTVGKTKLVRLPKIRRSIEDILAKRKIINRHWYPGETLKKLHEGGL